MGNCSCIGTPIEKNNQYIFYENQKVDEGELINNIKSKFENESISIDPINIIEFEEKLNSFPNVNELFEEFNTQIFNQSQKNLINPNQSTNMDSNDNDLVVLPNPIKISLEEGKEKFFKGFINKDNYFIEKGCLIDNNILYNGNFQNFEFNGKGILINKDGSCLFGDWVNGQCNGKGILRLNNNYEYEGDFVDNQKHGYGIEKYPDGSRYEGEFRDNKKNGRGKSTISGGETYEGQFKDDLYDGEGIYKWPSDSREYVGEFKKGNMNGKGINKFKDGSVYEGYYKNGLKHGSGKYTWPNGKVFIGNWLNNKLHGNGYYLLDNDKYNITFRFGKIISTQKEKEEEKRIKFGYENIINKENLENANEFICPICSKIFIQPQKCCGCFQNYCDNCVKDGENYKKCPKCQGNSYEDNLDLMHELISKVKVICNECKTNMDYKESLNHCHS